MSDSPATDPNVCYRHPDRQSYVLCQRCGRTICPECMTQAAVGVICPECMREQRASAPRTKPAVLTRMRGRGAPVVTYSIIGLTALVFLLQNLPGLAAVQSSLIFAPVYASPLAFEPWRMLTAALLHANILHIALNMYTLWIFGQLLEVQLGRIRFLVLYLISALAGSVGVIWLAPANQAVLGASGAIFGLMGAFLVIQRRLGGNMTQLLILVAVNFALGFFVPGIAWQAHLGGLVGGALVGLIYVETRARRRMPLQVGLLVALTLLLVVLSLRYWLFPIG